MQIDTLRYGDNFIYLLVSEGRAAVVDPGASDPVVRALEAHGITLERILLTHYHADHTKGCAALKRMSGCRIVGPHGGSIPLDETVIDETALLFANTPITVLSAPGHTACDVTYYASSEHALFCGDTLFAGGCGRLFTENAEQMWSSLCRLRALPDKTRIYGGHDYTLDNLQFAAHLEPDNIAIQMRLEAFQKTAGDQPSTIAEERSTNPFLRCDLPEFMQAVNMPQASPAKVFSEIRHRKDRW